MEERRQSTREPTYLPGAIYFNGGHGSLSCVIRDFSYEGARIVIFDPIDIPDEVELHIPERNRLMHATVRWRHGNKIGLAFSEVRYATTRRQPLELNGREKLRCIAKSRSVEEVRAVYAAATRRAAPSR